jgi:hypothetical protein
MLLMACPLLLMAFPRDDDEDVRRGVNGGQRPHERGLGKPAIRRLSQRSLDMSELNVFSGFSGGFRGANGVTHGLR